MKEKKNLKGLSKSFKALSKSEEGVLKGGFAVFSASSKIDVAKNVNVDVSGHTCACSCDKGTTVLQPSR
ncbi:hypothetical protein PG623_02010 [Riemerella anatipestifer]|nr:hypothetical protein [Riemerella anatipestifer]